MYIERNESINTLALFDSWWNQIPGSKLANNSAHGQTESSLSIDGLAEYLYLEHVSAEIDNQVANAARTPISIRKRLSKRDRTLMQRLTDSPARTGAAAPNSAILSGKKSVKTTVKPALPSKQSAIDKANAENIKNSNHKAMKKVVLLELRTIGIDRHHTDFNKYWSILYPGVKLALDDVVCKRLLTTEELRKNVEGHLRLLQKVR
ncbi:hypothetical protein BDF19DRAFT_193782 [Syncephalis fuscata]|nr:hypothetical protein BDF19DRAFT_193782 [Syncephalis fuscata]